MIVCYQCLKALDSKGELVYARKYTGDDTVCEWCEDEFESDELYDIMTELDE